MTTRPKLRLGSNLAPGLLAVALFGAMAAIVLNTNFGAMPSEPFAGLSVTSEIGYALLDLTALQSEAVAETEQFLISFLLIAVLLDAALDASLVLAKREEDGEPVTALSTTSSGRPSDSAGRAGSIGTGSPSAATDGGSKTRTDGGSETSADGGSETGSADADSGGDGA